MLYTSDAIHRKVQKEGIDNVILHLSSENLEDGFKQDLINSHLLVGGYTNLSLLYMYE